MQENKQILIVGLGNPGAKYSGTRHNVGFMAVDALAGPNAVWKKEKNALVTKSDKIIMAKPQTYMNLSGEAVRALMTFYKIPLENLIVIHDDLDLPIGKTRDKVGGGSGGHNGIKSIDSAVGRDYFRMRIGIGHPRDFGAPINPSDWVLGRFPPADLKLINTAIDGLMF